MIGFVRISGDEIVRNPRSLLCVRSRSSASRVGQSAAQLASQRAINLQPPRSATHQISSPKRRASFFRPPSFIFHLSSLMRLRKPPRVARAQLEPRESREITATVQTNRINEGKDGFDSAGSHLLLDKGDLSVRRRLSIWKVCL